MVAQQGGVTQTITERIELFEEVDELVSTLLFEQELSEINQTAVRIELARLHGVPLASVTLTATAGSAR